MSTNPLTKFFVSLMVQEGATRDECHRARVAGHSILAARLVDSRLHAPQEMIWKYDDWTDALHFGRTPKDELSVNSLKIDVVSETYARAAVKRRENLMAELAEEEKASK